MWVCNAAPAPAAAGFPASKLFGQGVSYTYDDVIFLPGHINFAAHEVRGHSGGAAAGLHPCIPSCRPAGRRWGALLAAAHARK